MNEKEFCKIMLYNINTACYYPIKRSFGQTLQTCNLEALIAYTKLSKSKNNIEQNIEFLVAGLCYNITKPGQQRNTYIKFEELLKRLNRESEIESFLKLRYDNNGYFAKKFCSLAKKAMQLLNANEQVNYIALLEDLKTWNNSNTTKLKWAMTITNIIIEDEE